MSKSKKKKKCEGSTDEEKANRELVALGFQAAPGASAQRSTSPLLPSLPMGPMCYQLMHGWLMTVSPGQRRAVSTLSFTCSHGTSFLCGLRSLMTLHLLDQGCKNLASKPRRLLLLHWAVTKSFQKSR